MTIPYIPQPNVAPNTPPINPSTVFLGLTFGAIFLLPNVLPE